MTLKSSNQYFSYAVEFVGACVCLPACVWIITVPSYAFLPLTLEPMVTATKKAKFFFHAALHHRNLWTWSEH